MRGGWTNLDGESRVWHYFVSAEGGVRSLCRLWSIHRKQRGISLEQGKDNSSQNCKVCVAKLRAVSEGEQG